MRAYLPHGSASDFLHASSYEERRLSSSSARAGSGLFVPGAGAGGASGRGKEEEVAFGQEGMVEQAHRGRAPPAEWRKCLEIAEDSR